LVALLTAGARVGGASAPLKTPVLRSQAVDLARLGVEPAFFTDRGQRDTPADHPV